MAGLRERQKQLTRESLVAGALELFDEKGYAATTVDDIATSAFATRATFYLHFSSKTDLMRELIRRADEILIREDDPPLTDVIASGQRQLIENFLALKIDQWPLIRPYLVAAHQAAPSEPEVAEALEKWFQNTVSQMAAGLDAAERGDPASRRIQCMLAFSQLEFLARRWFDRGLAIPREQTLAALTDSWCVLLGATTNG